MSALSCPTNHWGWKCAYICHCKDPSEACDIITGECESGCLEEWIGPGCSIGESDIILIESAAF